MPQPSPQGVVPFQRTALERVALCQQDVTAPPARLGRRQSILPLFPAPQLFALFLVTALERHVPCLLAVHRQLVELSHPR